MSGAFLDLGARGEFMNLSLFVSLPSYDPSYHPFPEKYNGDDIRVDVGI